MVLDRVLAGLESGLNLLSGSKATGSRSRLSRAGMPNGFFWDDLLWFGDAGSAKTAVSRGFIVEPDEHEVLNDEAKLDLSDRLRVLLATLGEEYALQVKYLVCSDYAEVLERYRRDTDAIQDWWRYRWQIWSRKERYERFRRAMEEGRLRREVLMLFFSRVVNSAPPFGGLSEKGLREHFVRLARREKNAFEEVNGAALEMIFPDCRVRAMGDEDHFLAYYRFLNPDVGAEIPNAIRKSFDPELSIQENCLHGDVVTPRQAGISFQYAGFNHAMLAMRELPKSIGPGIIGNLTNLGFVDYELTLNIYPRRAEEVIRETEATANQLQGDILTTPKRAFSLGEQLNMARGRIQELERGQFHPFKVFFALRLWARDADAVLARVGAVRNGFVAMAGARHYHATNAETARQLWYQTWPGWTYGTYRRYDLATDDQTVADLMPWSASFSGRLDGAEALYESPRGALVGLRTQVGGVPQHVLVFGAVSAGKSILLTDWISQIGHEFGYWLIVEEGLSHGVTAQTAGAEPIIVSPNSEITINYYDTNGVPLSNEQVGLSATLGLQMAGEYSGTHRDGARLMALESKLTEHIQDLYWTAWKEWAGRHPQEAHGIARRAFAVDACRRRMGGKRGEGNNVTFLDAWAELRDWEARAPGEAQAFVASFDEGEISRFATDPRTRQAVRDLGCASFKPGDFPTHSELVERLMLTGHTRSDDQAAALSRALKNWTAKGPYGRLLDGVANARLDGSACLIELGKIPDVMEPMRAAAHFLIMNTARQEVVRRPRAQRKLIVFEEGKRILNVPGGERMLDEFYAQMRKFGAVVVTVFQQYSQLKAHPAARASVFHNTKLFLVSAQPSAEAAAEIGEGLALSEAAVRTIRRYPLVEHQPGHAKYSSFTVWAPDPRRNLCGTMRNVASREVVYCGRSDGEEFDKRQQELAPYDDVVEGILTEARRVREVAGPKAS